MNATLLPPMEKLHHFAARASELSGHNKTDKLILVLCLVHYCDPTKFRRVNNLTWPQGHAVLLSDDKSKIERTNPSAQIRAIFKTGFFVNVGHDAAAMRRLVLGSRPDAHDGFTK